MKRRKMGLRTVRTSISLSCNDLTIIKGAAKESRMKISEFVVGSTLKYNSLIPIKSGFGISINSNLVNFRIHGIGNESKNLLSCCNEPEITARPTEIRIMQIIDSNNFTIVGLAMEFALVYSLLAKLASNGYRVTEIHFTENK